MRNVKRKTKSTYEKISYLFNNGSACISRCVASIKVAIAAEQCSPSTISAFLNKSFRHSSILLPYNEVLLSGLSVAEAIFFSQTPI